MRRGASTSTWSRPTAPRFRCASCIGLPRYGGNRRACARARAQPRARRGRRKPAPPSSALRGCSTRRPSPLPLSTAKAPSAPPTPPLCGCSVRAVDGVSPQSDACEPGRCRRAAEALAPGTRAAAIAGQGLIEPVDIAFEGDKERQRQDLSQPRRAAAKAKAKRRSPTPST